MKVDGSLGSLVQGVSQQAPGLRRSGQHTEQVNMTADPVTGLNRRHGSVWVADKNLGIGTASWQQDAADTATWRSFDYSAEGRDITVLYRSAPAYPGTTLPSCVAVYDKTNNQFLNVVRPAVDVALDNLGGAGVSAITAAGKYVFMAGNFNTPAAVTVDEVAATRENSVVWIRGGAYGRTYKITARHAFTGITYTFSFTTPKSSYQGTLVTNDILTSDPDYVKKVTDRQSAFNTAVTNWIGSAAAAIQPDSIVVSLAAAANAAFGAPLATAFGSTLILSWVDRVTVSDGGDGSLMTGLAQDCSDVSGLTKMHFVDKVVKVTPTSGESFYMKAKAKDPSVTYGVTEVQWSETAGQRHHSLGGLFYGVASGSNFYIASSASLLATILPGSHPAIADSAVGDSDSSPVPYFAGRKITYLGTFQDRLLVGCGSVIRASRVGDYLNFFRSTTLSVPADDAFEMSPTGGDDDTIRFSVLYDRDLLLFGNRRQYAISGRVPLTPTSANMPTVSTHVGADSSPPVSSGGVVFYAKNGYGSVSVHQMGPGRNPESPEAEPVSSQLNDYLSGSAIEMISAGPPSKLILRTTGARNTLFVFSYLDLGGERKQECWDRWVYHESLGSIIGVTNAASGDLIVFFLRTSTTDAFGTQQWLVADKQPLSGSLSWRPYLDSQRSWYTLGYYPGSWDQPSSGLSCAVSRDLSPSLPGVSSTLNTAAVNALAATYGSQNVWCGVQFSSLWSPTNPQVRDTAGQAMTTGRLTVTKLVIEYKLGAGFTSVVVSPPNTTSQTFDFGSAVAQGAQSVAVGRETREYQHAIYALDWRPMNITSVNWVGQLFHRPQRVG